MLTSGDSFLLSLFFILIPALTILAGVFMYSKLVIARYSKVIKRLYKMNFNSLETERKRISNDLHDHMGYKILIMNKSLENLKSNPLLKNNLEIERIESQIRLFQYDIHKVLESIHPRELSNGKWHEGIFNLASELSIGDTKIYVLSHTTICPKEEHLLQSYRIIQEKLANIIQHTNPKKIQIDITHEKDLLVVTIIYASKSKLIDYTFPRLFTYRGRGLSIINDRLKIIGGGNEIKYTDGYTIDSIFIPL
jgi:signal transduction histidine kinase